MLEDSRPLQFFTEYLDLIRFPSKGHEEKLTDYLWVRYAGQRIDLIVCFSFPALQFWLDYGMSLFPKSPVLFMGVEERRLQQVHLNSNFAGLTFTFNDALLLDTILRLHPQTRHIFLVGGTTEFERFWVAQRLCNLKARHSELSFEDLSLYPETRLTQKLAHLPQGSIVLFQDLYRTGSGRCLQGEDSVRLVCQAANAPVYGFFANFIGKGLTGGLLVDVNTGIRAAGMSRRLLSGENPASVGIANSENTQFLFDGRQLKRWGIRERQLPPGSVTVFKQPSFWSLYKWRIIFVVALFLVQTALLLGLLAQRTRRKRADAAVQQLNGQLIHAQEAERARIARELHDDIGQQIAMIGMGVNTLVVHQA
jgi:signal transduction histidine kinase